MVRSVWGEWIRPSTGRTANLHTNGPPHRLRAAFVPLRINPGGEAGEPGMVPGSGGCSGVSFMVPGRP